MSLAAEIDTLVSGLAPEFRAEMRRKTKRILATGAETHGDVITLLDHRSRAVRMTAIWLIGQLNVDRRKSVPRLVRLLTTARDEAEELEAAKALAGLGGTSVRHRLELVLRTHTETHVRAMAAYALGSALNRPAWPLLAEKLADTTEAPVVREYAAEALAYVLHGPRVPGRARDAVLAALEDPEPGVRFWACFAAASLSLRDAEPLLEKLVDDPADGWLGWRTVGQEADWALHVMQGDHEYEPA